MPLRHAAGCHLRHFALSMLYALPHVILLMPAGCRRRFLRLLPAGCRHLATAGYLLAAEISYHARRLTADVTLPSPLPMLIMLLEMPLSPDADARRC